MQGSMLSILAVYNWDPTIFDGLRLPALSDLPADGIYIDQPEPLDKQLLIDNLVFDLAELDLVYSDPDTLKKVIEIWSQMNFRNWLELWKTLLYKYNPIWNKDGTYTETRKTGGTSSSSASGSSNSSASNSTTDNGTVTHNVTGYDTNSFSPDTQDVRSGGPTTTGSASSSASNQSGSAFSEDETLERKERGNIGVTTTQAMIKEQREIVQFNLYQYIIDSFKERFCILVY